jgi:hypothetical protein
LNTINALVGLSWSYKMHGIKRKTNFYLLYWWFENFKQWSHGVPVVIRWHSDCIFSKPIYLSIYLYIYIYNYIYIYKYKLTVFSYVTGSFNLVWNSKFSNAWCHSLWTYVQNLHWMCGLAANWRGSSIENILPLKIKFFYFV